MGSLVKKKSGDDTLSESGTESRESSSSGSGSSCDDSTEEVKKVGSRSPSLLGWPIRKAEVSKKISLSDEMNTEDKTHFDDLKYKKSGAIVSGFFFFKIFLSCVCLVDEKMCEKEKPYIVNFELKSLYK